MIQSAAGNCPGISISHQSTDWALERSFVGAVRYAPQTGVVIIDNARLHKGRHIASAFLERFLTDPRPFLFSTGTGSPVRTRNSLVLAISTNFGTVSEDLMNRALPIHLNPVGNVADRHSAIGNPKLEYLPANRGRIEAELRGMIERWKAAGQPLDTTVRHPFTDWARTVGGILRVSGFTDFLANYSIRRTADDPIRHALGILGTAQPDQWLRPGAWAQFVVQLGLVKTLIPEADRDTEASRERGIGVVLSAHRDETFTAESDDEMMTLKLEKARRRLDGDSEPSTRYRFGVLEREPIPADTEQDGN